MYMLLNGEQANQARHYQGCTNCGINMDVGKA